MFGHEGSGGSQEPAEKPQPSAGVPPTDIRNPDYFHKVVDCQWACPAHTPVPEYIRLIAVGRTAFSCYILETLICTTIFYGHGLGLLGIADRLRQLILTIVIWIVLLILAPLWLHRFRYGALEWLWERAGS